MNVLLSNIKPVSPRDLLIYVETGVGMIADKPVGERLSHGDVLRMDRSRAILKLLVDAQPGPVSVVPKVGVYSTFGMAQGLHEIVHRASLAPGDLDLIRAVVSYLNRQIGEGRA